MQDLQVAQTLTSLLVKVDLQSRTVTAEIPLDQGFAKGESVVAYASGKKGSYVATNKIQGQKLATKIYSFTTIGKKYQVTQLASFSTSVSEFTSSRVLTKLFCFGNFIVTNNGQDLYFLNPLRTEYINFNFWT